MIIFNYCLSMQKDNYREVGIMGKVLTCKDIGTECDFEAHGATDEEVLNLCAVHAKKEHGMDEMDNEMVEKCKAAIKEE